MPQPTTSELPKPRSWDEFEDIVWDLYSRLWKDPHAQRHGRTGQAQQGVDIYGQPAANGGRFVGVQCKRYDDGTLTEAGIRGEIAKAEAFEPPLAEYIIATTERRDAKLQEVVRKINAACEAEGGFPVRLVFWEDVCAGLTDPDHLDLLLKHFGSWAQVLHSSGQAWVKVNDLRRDSFKLGDNAAANFPYIAGPVQDAFDRAVATLLEAGRTTGTKRGVLVLGEASAGKTRLALEALSQTLPEWSVLRWGPASTAAELPGHSAVAGRDLVVLLDDLQEFAAASTPDGKALDLDPRAPLLRKLLEDLRTHANGVVVVATCRAEDERSARAALGWLFLELETIRLPTFSKVRQDPATAAAIEAFDQHHAPFVEEWDGTLGSLVLGLAAKESLYLSLGSSPTASILRAMKLLANANVVDHTARRVRAVCGAVFGEEALEDSTRAWRAAVDELVRLQFVSVETHLGEQTLVIRQDVYFAKVITDYRGTGDDAHRVAGDLSQLKDIFVGLADVRALVDLSGFFQRAKLYTQALEALVAAVQIDRSDTRAWYAVGSVYFDMGSYEQALSVANTGLTLSPADSLLWHAKAACLNQLERREEALEAIDQAVSLAPDDAIEWAAKGQLLVDLERYDEALPALTKAVELNPRDATSWCNRGVILAKSGRHEEALESCTRSLEIEPDSAVAWVNKADSLVNLRRYEEALEACDRVLAGQEQHGRALLEKARALAGLGRHDDAFALAREAVSLNTDGADVWILLGYTLRQERCWAKACDAYGEAVALDPGRVEGWRGKGAALHGTGRYDEAVDAYTRALALTTDIPTRARLLSDKARALAQAGQFEAARDAAGEALAFGEPLLNAWTVKALAHVRLGEYEESLAAAEQALKSNPTNVQAWENKGQALLGLGRLEEALAAFERRFALEPGKPDKLTLIGALLGTHEHFEEAMVYFDSAIAVEPEYSEAWKLKGECLLLLERDAEGLAALECGLALAPEDARTWNNKGVTLGRLGRHSEARAAHQESLRIEPGYKPALDNLAQLEQNDGDSAERTGN